MNTPQERVAFLENQLTDAHRDAEAERRGELVAKLRAVREELLAARTRYKEESIAIRTQSQHRDQIQTKIIEAMNAISASFGLRPAVASYLPNDPELVAWRKQHTALERHRDKLIAARDAFIATMPDPTFCISCEGPNGLLARLEHSGQSLLSILEDSLGEGLKGGLFSVL